MVRMAVRKGEIDVTSWNRAQCHCCMVVPEKLATIMDNMVSKLYQKKWTGWINISRHVSKFKIFKQIKNWFKVLFQSTNRIKHKIQSRLNISVKWSASPIAMTYIHIYHLCKSVLMNEKRFSTCLSRVRPSFIRFYHSYSQATCNLIKLFKIFDTMNDEDDGSNHIDNLNSQTQQ